MSFSSLYENSKRRSTNSDTESHYDNEIYSKDQTESQLSLPSASDISIYYSLENVTNNSSYLTADFKNSILDAISFTEKQSLADGASSIQTSSQDCSAYFDDGIRRIDFVLVYDKNSPMREARETFEENLKYEGLELEYAKNEEAELEFVKIHAPWEVLSRYGEIMQFKMPIKEPADFDISKCYKDKPIRHASIQAHFSLEPYLNFDKRKRLTLVFSRSKEYLFAIPERKEDLFNPAQRSQIIEFILKRKRFTQDPADVFGFGIKKLLADGAYLASFPLHEGICDDNTDINNPRLFLLKNWATVRCIFKQQPLDEIRCYFGVKIGLYFAWLGFYTYMLTSASIVGILCFIYGCITLNKNVPSKEICGIMSNVTMCPLCEDECRYWKLGESCNAASLIYLFDNAATTFYAVFISIWGTVFLELWKRYSARITYRWDLAGYDSTDEHPRPEYLARLADAKKKLNVVTGMYEPYIPFWRKRVPYTLFSMSIVLLLVSIAVAAVVGVILYRLSLRAALTTIGASEDTVTQLSVIITSITAALLNLICIMIFNWIYSKIATYLTEIEMHRTLTQFDNSLTLKMFLLQFVNYYSSIFYIAFFKGKFVGHPGDYVTFVGYRQEECGMGGCLMELAIQLIIIMVGKQALFSFMEMAIPWISWLYKQWQIRGRHLKHVIETIHNRWEEDYTLVEWKTGDLFYEYLEMVLQFGFITIFVAAFPLAPVFALVNNAFEVRLDARKLVTSYRRPVGQRVPDIGIWYPILNAISRFAVLTNAIIIAFTSNTVPRLIYRMTESPDGSLRGFINNSLSYFDVEDFHPNINVKPLDSKIELCRYQDFRHPPWSELKYQRTEEFLFLLVARFAFVIIFVIVISLLKSLVRGMIPDVPKRLKEQIRHETFLTNEMMIEQELRRARGLLQKNKNLEADQSNN
ncbi:anoctamin-1-like [Centruroides vittatus]|uniref:anoctamin-1-like n=1 Tax=Centruroides vittatus TaxID=120091 RepID=UPI00350EFE11